jgi:hypothetical protein
MKQGLIIDKDGTKSWFLNGELHREDGPAIEYKNGSKAWYINGKLHREDGPAVENSNGDKGWFLNGIHHREDGPAVEYISGYKAWYLNDKLVYSKDNNNLHKYPNLSESFKHSIIKYRLTV